MPLLSFTLVILLLMTFFSPLAYTSYKAYADQQWPWGTSQEPFPWLDYLVQLAKQQGGAENVRLVIITRHDIAIQEKTKELFLQSEVAQRLNITDLVFAQVNAPLFESYLNRTSIDVVWGGGPTLFDILYQDGYLAPIDPSYNQAAYAALYEASKFPDNISGIPLKRFGDDGKIYWIAAALSSFGFTINYDKLQEWNLPTPKTWVDLSNPIFATSPVLSVGGADPTMSTSNTRIYEIILQAYGWELGWMVLTGFAANAKIYQASDAVREAVIQGEIAAGVTIDFYGYTAMQVNPHTEYIMPAGQTAINGDPIALSKSSQHVIQALAFIAWVLSEYGGQQVWLDREINRLPINNQVFQVVPPDQNRTDLAKSYEQALENIGFIFNDSRAASWEFTMQQYFSSALAGGAHSDLVNTWSYIANAWINGDIDDNWMAYYAWKLLSPLNFTDPRTGQTVHFSEEYAVEINQLMRSDATLLNQLKTTWESAMHERATSVLDEFSSNDHTQPAPSAPCIAYQLVKSWGDLLNKTVSLPQQCQTPSGGGNQTNQTTGGGGATPAPGGNQANQTTPENQTTGQGKGGLPIGLIVAIVVIVILAVLALRGRR